MMHDVVVEELFDIIVETYVLRLIVSWNIRANMYARVDIAECQAEAASLRRRAIELGNALFVAQKIKNGQ